VKLDEAGEREDTGSCEAAKDAEGRPAKRSTRDAILEASLELFNREGFDGTSIVMICEHINIMSGNLTYYFPKKRDIVLAIKDTFDASLTRLNQRIMDDLLGQNRTTSPRHTHDLLRSMLEIIWDHRFFFTSMMSLHRLDRRIYMAFRQVEQQARVGLSQLVQRAITDGTVRPLNYPNSPSAYADNIWYLMWGCMFFQTARDRKLDPAKSVVINNCLLQLGALMEPVVSPEFVTAYCGEVTRRR
jgi:AcrR family transcriptional regulator